VVEAADETKAALLVQAVFAFALNVVKKYHINRV
jgi:hypothetical protein